MAGGEAAEPSPLPASAGKATKRRRLLRRGAAMKCPSALGSEVEEVPISGDESGGRQAANDAFSLLVNMAFPGNYHDDNVSSTGQSSPTKYQPTSHSPSSPPLASQGSTSQLPPPQRPSILTPPVSMTASTSSSTDAGPARKGRGHRGPARGLAISGLQEGQFLEVQIHGGTGVGCHGSKFVSQLGIVARTHCKIWQSNWSKLPSDTKEAIFKDLQLKFRFERTHAAEKEIIQHMGEMHRKYRGALKKRFFSGKSFEEAVTNVPFGVDPADWQVMCEKWSTSAEQSVANRNKANHAHQTMPYRLGRRNIYQVKEEFRKNQGRDPDRTEIFSLTRSKKLPDGNQAWVDDESREKMDQITQLMEQPSERGGEILTSEQAFVRVMGKDRPGRVRCAGRAVTLRKWYGPSEEGSPSSSSYQHLLEQNQTQAQKIEEQAEEILRLKKSLQEDNQQQQIQMCKMRKLQMQMQQQMQEMLTCFRSSQGLKTSLVGSNESEGDEVGSEED